MSISFHRSKRYIDSCYKIGGTLIKSVTTLRDLGIILFLDLTFNAHVEAIYGKSLRSM